MSETPKKQNFLHGAALLAAATAIVKLIGALYKIPLKAVIGEQGYSYFSTAYDIYAVLLMISTAGLPVAMSRMISEASAKGHYGQVRRIYKTSRGIFLGLGIVSCALMMLLCHQLAAFQRQPDAWAAILCLGPCALLMGIVSTIRGFFQGQGNMAPTSVSQVLEAVCKLFVGLAAALLIARSTGSTALAAGGAILGVTLGSALSVGYLFGKFRPAYRAMPETTEQVLSYNATAKGLLAIAVPITIGSAGLQLLTVLETSLYMGRLQTVHGLSGAVSETMNGIYKFSQTVFNMPCAFIIPITVSIIPAITSALTLRNHEEVRKTEESAARVTGLIAMPCAVGLTLLARPVMRLLGGYSAENLELATSLMAISGVSVFLYAVVQYTNAVMQAHGKAHIPVINMLLSGLLKLAMVYILVGNSAFGINGVPLGAALCYLCIGVLNLAAIRRYVPQKPRLVRNLLRPVLPAAIMGVAVWACYALLTRLLGADGSRVVLCGAPIALGVAVYCVAVVLCRSITAEDCRLLPKGDKIAKLLRL